jgi:hypothetical protein
MYVNENDLVHDDNQTNRWGHVPFEA